MTYFIHLLAVTEMANHPANNGKQPNEDVWLAWGPSNRKVYNWGNR